MRKDFVNAIQDNLRHSFKSTVKICGTHGIPIPLQNKGNG